VQSVALEQNVVKCYARLSGITRMERVTEHRGYLPYSPLEKETIVEKPTLAADLRAAQIRLGQVPTEMIRNLSDDEIIDCYITCSCCGVKQAEGSDLALVIDSADDTDHFFKLLGNFAHIKHAIDHTEKPRVPKVPQSRRRRERP
jgi:hypothetical protein